MPDKETKSKKRQRPAVTECEILTEGHVNYALARLKRATIAQAREAGGFSKGSISLDDYPPVQKFMAVFAKTVAELTAKKAAESPTATSLILGREQIIENLWKLATLAHTETNGTIHGQVNASKELAEIFGMKIDLSADLTRDFASRSTEDLEHFAQHGTFLDGSRPSAIASQDQGATADGKTKVN